MALAWETSVPSAYRTEFINKVIAISSRLNIDPNWLMVVMRFESANTFSPTVKNKNSEAYGLIQFTNVGISGLNVTLAQLRAMTAVQQLDWVEKYLARYKGLTDLYQLYLAVFAPAYIGRPDSQAVYKSPTQQYTANSALDTDKDGIITIGEIKATIKKYIPAGYSDGTTLATTLATNGKPVMLIGLGLLGLFLTLKKS